jgi:hypothetical protein
MMRSIIPEDHKFRGEEAGGGGASGGLPTTQNAAPITSRLIILCT